MSAVSSAASLPIAPITMPTSAAASAGASLTPSPTMAIGAVRVAEILDGGHLVGRQLTRTHVIDAELRAGRARGRVVIAGEHRDARDALRAQIGHHLRRACLRPIADAEHADRHAVAGHDHRRHAALDHGLGERRRSPASSRRAR